MDIEEKSRRDLIERYKRLERKESQMKGTLAHSKQAVSKQVKDFLRTPHNMQVARLTQAESRSVGETWAKP